MHFLRVLSDCQFGNPRLGWRPAGTDDTAFLKTLFDADSRSMFRSLDLQPAMIDFMVEQQWHARRTGYATQYPEAVDLIILYDDRPVGRFMLTQHGDRLHLIDLMLSTQARGRGIGSEVLTSAQAVAAALGLGRVTLTVAATNADAQRLYDRLGFIVEPGQDDASISIMMTYVIGKKLG